MLSNYGRLGFEEREVFGRKRDVIGMKKREVLKLRTCREWDQERKKVMK